MPSAGFDDGFLPAANAGPRAGGVTTRGLPRKRERAAGTAGDTSGQDAPRKRGGHRDASGMGWRQRRSQDGLYCQETLGLYGRTRRAFLWWRLFQGVV